MHAMDRNTSADDASAETYAAPRLGALRRCAGFLLAAGVTCALMLTIPLSQKLTGASRSRIEDMAFVAEPKPADQDFSAPEAQPPEPVDEEASEAVDEVAFDEPSMPAFSGFDLGGGTGDLVIGMGPGADDLKGVAAEAAREVFEASEIDERPQVVNQLPPLYPDALRRLGVEGRVVVAFVVDERGHVLNPSIESSTDPRFDSACVDAVRKWRFKPGVKGGRPVRTQVRVPFPFRLSR